MIKDFVTVDKQKNVRHRAIIGDIADFVDAGFLPEYTTTKSGSTIRTINISGSAVRHDFSGEVKTFRSEASAEKHLRRVYA